MEIEGKPIFHKIKKKAKLKEKSVIFIVHYALHVLSCVCVLN